MSMFRAGRNHYFPLTESVSTKLNAISTLKHDWELTDRYWTAKSQMFDEARERVRVKFIQENPTLMQHLESEQVKFDCRYGIWFIGFRAKAS